MFRSTYIFDGREVDPRDVIRGCSVEDVLKIYNPQEKYEFLYEAVKKDREELIKWLLENETFEDLEYCVRTFIFHDSEFLNFLLEKKNLTDKETLDSIREYCIHNKRNIALSSLEEK